MKAKILVVPGDGIGPEVTREAAAVLGVVCGKDLELDEETIGGAAIDAHGVAIQPHVVEKAKAADAILLGAVGGPKWDDPRATVRPEQALFALRQGLRLFPALR